MIKLGVISPSEIAFRRFMPALKANPNFDCVGYAVNSIAERYNGQEVDPAEAQAMLDQQNEKVQAFVDNYGGRIFTSYMDMITCPDIDAIYLPLPPALHYKWAKLALEHGKHVLVEKPCTLSYAESQELIQLALDKGLGFHENYMFVFHQQLQDIQDIIASGEIGQVRLYKVQFGFPKRAADDFRYNKALGGGALIDAGGYTIRYASMLLGEGAQVAFAETSTEEGYEVDLYGSGVMVSPSGQTVQLAFGMDNDYRCELDVWGSLGTLQTDRILTAPAGFEPTATIRKNGQATTLKLSSDDSFAKSIQVFHESIVNADRRQDICSAILKQAQLLEDFQQLASQTEARFSS